MIIMFSSDAQFYHKWAVLTDPDDTAGSCKGYIKCDISIITKVNVDMISQKVTPESQLSSDGVVMLNIFW